MSIHDNVFDLLNEITEPTGPILSWKARLHIKHLFVGKDLDTEAQIKEAGSAIADKLRKCSLFDREDVIVGFESVYSPVGFNAWLEALYAICDKKRILVQ